MAGDSIAGLGRLRVQREFRRVAAQGVSAAMFGVVVVVRRWRDGEQPDSALDGAATGLLWRYGLTASRRVGKAVIRNRARRRLRELAREIIPIKAPPAQ